jgi:dihydrodipicolinate synthase/N-acetylneuraminate lyase
MNSDTSSLLARLRGGVAPAMATPIDESGHRVAISQVFPLVDFLIERGVSALFVGGTTGEGVLLELDDRKRLHEAVMEAAGGRVPVLLSVSHNVTRHAFELAEHAQSIDADAVVCMTPWFYPLAEADLLDFFDMVAAGAPDTPFLAYDIPQQALNGITPALVPKLAQAIPTFAGLKCSRNDAQAIRALLAALPEQTILLAGNERILLGSLALGAAGSISGLATALPEPFVALTGAFAAGNLPEAQRWHLLINRLLDRLERVPRLGAVKAILAARGVPVGAPIPPRPSADSAIWADLLRLLDGESF